MAPHIRGVDMRNRNVEARTWPADFFGRRHDRLRTPENFTHPVPTRNMPERAMFDLTCRANDRSFTVALYQFRIAPERRHQRQRHFQPKRFQVIHEAVNLFDIAASIRIPDDHERRSSSQRRGRSWATFMENLFDQQKSLANLNLRHGLESCQGRKCLPGLADFQRRPLQSFPASGERLRESAPTYAARPRL